MARIRLSRTRVEEGRLPAVCLRCGEPATLTKEKTFSWHPEWVSALIVLGLLCFLPLFLAGIIALAVTTERMRVPVPLCEAHNNHWLWRSLFIYIGLAFFLTTATIGLTLWLPSRQPPDWTGELGGYLCMGTAAGGLVWLVVAAFVQNGAVRAAEITARGITLIEVSPQFLKRFEAERAREEISEGKAGAGPHSWRAEDTGQFRDKTSRRRPHAEPDHES
jgi:hypothetical protein